MRNENPTGQPAGKSTAEPRYDGGLHSKNETQRSGYHAANVNSAMGRDVVTPAPRPAKSSGVSAYLNKTAPTAPKEFK
jgi:hypothetical protein